MKDWQTEIQKALLGNWDDRKTVIRVSQSGLDRLGAIFQIAIDDTVKRERRRAVRIIKRCRLVHEEDCGCNDCEKSICTEILGRQKGEK